MTRFNLFLLIVLLFSALYLVHMRYESRRLFIELDHNLAMARQLATDHERLQVEKRTQATPLRVEQLAKSALQMRTTTPAITQYVPYAAPTLHAATSPAPVPAQGAQP